MNDPTRAEPNDERLTAAVRFNLSPTEHGQLQALAEQEERTVAAVVRRAVRDTIRRHGPVTHSPHPPIQTDGLADGCPRCDQHAADPFVSLDEVCLRELVSRLRDGKSPRSDNEARAMDVVRRARRDGRRAEKLAEPHA